MRECKIVVGCRVRPLNNKEKELRNRTVWRCSDGISIHQAEEEESDDGPGLSSSSGRALGDKNLVSFSYDHVFDQSYDNDAVYETLALPIIKSVLNGFHGTIFAYGQTSSGKTHTLLGTPEEMGIILHSVYDIFEHVFNAPPEEEYLIRVSYMEIYNEEMRDLLGGSDKSSKTKGGLRIVDDSKKGCEIKGLKEVVVLSPDHVLQLLKQGEEQRHYGATLMNYTSSRSHTVFRLVVESRVDLSVEDESKSDSSYKAKVLSKRNSSAASKEEASENQVVQTATLNLVDLAGSERVSKTGATGSLLKEGAAINKSLLVLGTVINRLAEGTKGHIPFRDSKLTRLLTNSLGGNAQTAMVCALSPAARNLGESKGTLLFASRVKTIVNKAVKNHLNDKSALLDQYRSEIEELKLKLATGVAITDAPGLDTVRQQLEEEAARNAELEEKYERVYLDQKNNKKEIEAMRKLTLLTSKVAANPYLAGQVQTLMAKLTSGERSVAEVTAELEALKKNAEEDEELQFSQGNPGSKVVSFSQLGRILGVKKTKSMPRRHISILAQGIVASISRARESEQEAEMNDLVNQHFKEKENHLEEKVADLKKEVNKAKTQAQASVQELVELKKEFDEMKIEQPKELESAKKELEGTKKELFQVKREQHYKLLVANEVLEKVKKEQADKLHAVSKELETTKKGLGEVKKEHDKELDASKKEFKATKDKLEAANGELVEANKAIHAGAEALSSERARLLTTTKAHKGELNTLLERLEKQQQASEEQNATYNAQILELTQTVDAYKNKISSLEQVSGQVEEISKALALENEKQEQREKEVAEREKQSAELASAEQACNKARAAATILSLEQQVKNLTSDLESKVQSESAAAATAAAASVAMLHREQREDSLLEEIEKLKRQLSAVEESLATKNPALGWEMESLRSALSEAEAANHALEQEIETQRQRLADGVAQHSRLSSDHVLLEQEASRTREQLASTEQKLANAMTSLRELNLFVEDQLLQYQRALNEECRAEQSSSKQAKTAIKRCKDMETELGLMQADASRATETFIRYQKMAEARELHLTNLLASQYYQQQQQPSIHTRMSNIKQQLNRNQESSASTSQQQPKAPSGEIQRLKEQLNMAKDELDVFRRLDVYSASLKRGMAQVGAAKKAQVAAPAARYQRQSNYFTMPEKHSLDKDLIAKRNRLLELQQSNNWKK